MKFITVTELKAKATQIVTEIESTKEEMIITKNGKPVALMRFVNEHDFMLKENEKGKENGSNAKEEGKKGNAKRDL